MREHYWHKYYKVLLSIGKLQNTWKYWDQISSSEKEKNLSKLKEKYQKGSGASILWFRICTPWSTRNWLGEKFCKFQSNSRKKYHFRKLQYQHLESIICLRECNLSGSVSKWPDVEIKSSPNILKSLHMSK